MTTEGTAAAHETAVAAAEAIVSPCGRWYVMKASRYCGVHDRQSLACDKQREAITEAIIAAEQPKHRSNHD